MRNTLLFTAIIIALLSHVLGNAQETQVPKEPKTVAVDSTDQNKSDWAKKIDKEVKALNEQKKMYEANLREQLANEIKKINSRLSKDDNYSEDQAETDKRKIAQEYAERIKKHNEMVDSQIAFAMVRGESDVNDFSVGFVWKREGGFGFDFSDDEEELWKKQERTTSTSSLSLGYNYVSGENLGINDFSYPNNNFFSFGIIWQTALNKSHTLRINYGAAYQSHGTEINGGRAFSINTDNTVIENLGFSPDKAKFRQDQIVFPFQLEFGNTTKKEYEDGRVRYQQWDKWKFGVGGFAGFNVSSRLKLKYEENGRDIKQTTVDAFDNEVFVYGVEAYVGYDQINFFGRMNLNDVFKTGSVDAQYVTFGIRFQ